MSDPNDNKSFGSANVMPVTGSGCGIRPSKAAMEVEFGIDFSAAVKLLEQPANNHEVVDEPLSQESK